jgi:hypothetical protein
MKKTLMIAVLMLFNLVGMEAQTFYSLKKGNVHFFAGTPLEDIEADNSKTTSFLNIKTGDVLISMPVREFKFKSALMEEHFNENYMESEKFPKSDFKGKILNIDQIDFSQSTPFTVKVQGVFTIHGVSQSKTIDVVLKNAAGIIQAETKFNILLGDYNIQRPQILWEKLSEQVAIDAILYYSLYK